MRNGYMWRDTEGKDIQAHGGCIIRYEGIYYWYGEHKGALNCPNTTRVDVIGVSCYSSFDLVNWKYEGLVFEANKEDENSPVHTSKVLERPKVVYNEKNKNFVLWMHVDTAEYTYAGVGIAISDKPTGKFKLINVTIPNRQESRDMTIYKDSDGVAWLIHSKDWNKTLNIARLNEDYTDLDGFYTSVLIDQEREAPALFQYNGMYYMITSGCTGWAPNAALLAESPQLLGKWKLIDNPCEGEGRDLTFGGQSSYIFEANGKFYLMLDHWRPYDLQSSGYSILPIQMQPRYIESIGATINTVKVVWQQDWLGID